jgi:hypothetical protein
MKFQWARDAESWMMIMLKHSPSPGDAQLDREPVLYICNKK